MSVQTEKSLLIDLLQNSNDISLIQKVKEYLMNEIQAQELQILKCFVRVLDRLGVVFVIH